MTRNLRQRQLWLESGPLLTRETRDRILEDVAPRARGGLASSWMLLLQALPAREPGEEG